ncbi:hypothetical protein [Evansella tamaricis]|uniref:NADH dehydrogenase subunit 6 n=1 Tax=Evansella tamaricis TaxID=2069301 RepID=A0ABS6JHD4_9BACI|nr:hypothetical protein [Evansella tamaricis]MBU9713087.1 hypothetical protein [Evansella tamaricis]
MNNPHYVALWIVIGLYILSELFLLRFPKYVILKYIPSLLGIIGSVLVAVWSYQNIMLFDELIHYIFFSIVLFCLSGIIFVIMSARKPFRRKKKKMVTEDEVEETEDEVETEPSDKIEEPETIDEMSEKEQSETIDEMSDMEPSAEPEGKADDEVVKPDIIGEENQEDKSSGSNKNEGSS